MTIGNCFYCSLILPGYTTDIYEKPEIFKFYIVYEIKSNIYSRQCKIKTFTSIEIKMLWN